ncbi:MAG: RimK family alpha-L-glutamate ligase [Myxococcaceae bacterium]
MAAKRPPVRAKKKKSKSARRKLLCILSRKRSLYSTSRMVEAGKKQGHRVIVFDTLRCNLVLGLHGPSMVYRGVQVRGLHSVIPRIGASITGYGLSVVNHLEMMGVPVVNGATAIARSRDKLRCLQLLSKAGLPIPRSVLARDRRDLVQLVDEIGGLPCIIKLIKGTQGVGVMIAHTMDEAKTMLDTFWNLDQEIVLQEFIAESRGRDVRALVVGDKVVGAMRRQAKKGEFRSNLHRGGEGSPIELPREYVEAAIKAARVTGLHVAGVDMLESSEGPKIMEVNSSPGFEGLERATGEDIAGAIVEHAMWFGDAMSNQAGSRASPPLRRLIES